MRLKKRADFLAAAKGGRCARATMVLQCRRRTDDGAARFGFTVTKKTGGSVERSRMRRRLKEAVRMLSPQLARAGHDYVVIARRAALEARFSRILGDLEACLHQFGKPERAAV